MVKGIPQILHYVWLGEGPLPPIAETCRISWKKFLPGWEIRRWDESNSPMSHPFVREMMSRGLPAFASDYIRLHALLGCGGLYLDTDVELLRSPGMVLEGSDLVVGLLSLQNRLNKCSVGTSWIAAPPGHEALRRIFSRYETMERAVMNNTLFTAEIMPRFRHQEIPAKGSFECFESPGIRLYHPDFFNPVAQGEGGQNRPHARACSVALHHAEGNWGGEADPLPWGRRILDLRIDRKILRPIEKMLKALRS